MIGQVETRFLNAVGELLRAASKKNAPLSAEKLLETIHGDVVQFVGGEGFQDDVTMVAIKRVQ